MDFSKEPTPGFFAGAPVMLTQTKPRMQPMTEGVDRKYTRREVHVAKEPGEIFGAALATFHFRVYVVFVFQFTRTQNFTAAYRAGLRFGDEIISINNQSVSELDECQRMRLLAKADALFLEVVDSPHQEMHTVNIGKNDRSFGIQEYSAGEIVRVAKYSPAGRAGLIPHQTIISINNESTLGFSDRQILDAISKAFRKSGPVNIVIMESDIAEMLLSALLDSLLVLKVSALPHELIDHDFSLASIRLHSHNSSLSLLDRLALFETPSNFPINGSTDGFLDSVREWILGLNGDCTVEGRGIITASSNPC